MTQLSYSRLWGSPGDPATRSHCPLPSDTAARQARDQRWAELRSRGFLPTGSPCTVRSASTGSSVFPADSPAVCSRSTCREDTTSMHKTVDYSKSPAPSFDAVEDIRNWLGDSYDEKAAIMRTLSQEDFAASCGLFLGIEGFPVQAWYEHFHGQGAWKK